MSTTPNPSLAQIAQQILEDTLHNIIHDVVLTQHHEHKRLLSTLDSTTKLPHCETCKLPRLLEPPLAPKVRGALSEPPTNTTYCDRRPWARKPGHDIYGNPFLKSDVTGRPLTKKEREASAKSKKDNDGGDGNDDAPGSPGEGGGAGEREAPVKLEKGEKKASKVEERLKKGEYVPWHTCPQCKRSLLITRFARHLEACMGLNGRAASRNALAKMTNGSGSTPAGSRSGTPAPSSQDGAGARGDGDDDDDEMAVKGPGGVRKKLLKKGLKDKAKKEKEKEREKSERPSTSAPASGGGKPPKGLPSKRLPNGKNSPAPSSVGGGEGKRDRDELDDGYEEEIHVKKRQKLQRVGSTASVVSQSTVAPDMERGDSNDGSSFVGDGSLGGD